MNDSAVMAQFYRSGFSLREVAAILGTDRKLVQALKPGKE